MKSGHFLILSFLLMLISLPAYSQISADFTSGGAVKIGPSTTTCNGSAEGALRWDTVNKNVEMCDGTGWKKVIATPSDGAPSLPDPNTGYFVVTNTRYNTNLGGLAGANASCLTDLTNNDWMNKADATSRGLLIGTKVRAFLCDGTSTCQNPLANSTYTFAVSGNTAKGGAWFTADASGLGPGNTQNWSGANYFGSATYWTGRPTGQGTASTWANTGISNWTSCLSWTRSDSGSGFQAMSGMSNSSIATRWANNSQMCTTALDHQLICMVHP